MNPHSSPWRKPRSRGFSLVEIMISVLIIGLLAAMAMPGFRKVRQASQNSRFISDLRTFAQAFETYSLNNGSWPANGTNSEVPPGMSGEFRDAAWKTPRNSVGGVWNWDYNKDGNGPSNAVAAIATVNVTASDVQMAAIDSKIDDGNLNTGVFQKVGMRFSYILQK